MPEPNEEVKQSEETSTSEQDVAKDVEQETTTEETTTQETTEQTQEESKPQKQEFSPVDEKGVPWMNRYHESERKSRELLENLESKMGEILSKQSTQSQPEPSISQLEQFALERPDQRPWVEEKKAEIIQKGAARLAQNEFKAVEEKRTAEQKRQNAYNYVVQTYPECIVRDNFGNTQWNLQHPMVQHMGVIMQDKRFVNDPEGLLVAADIAYGRMARTQSGQTQKKVKVLQQNLKKVQKGTMIEGGGQQATKSTKDELTKAKEALFANRSDKKVAHNVVKAYLKKYGVIEE